MYNSHAKVNVLLRAIFGIENSGNLLSVKDAIGHRWTQPMATLSPHFSLSFSAVQVNVACSEQFNHSEMDCRLFGSPVRCGRLFFFFFLATLGRALLAALVTTAHVHVRSFAYNCTDADLFCWPLTERHRTFSIICLVIQFYSFFFFFKFDLIIVIVWRFLRSIFDFFFVVWVNVFSFKLECLNFGFKIEISGFEVIICQNY